MRTLAEDYACVEVRERPPIVWFDLLPLIAPFKTHDALGATMEALGVLASAGPPRSSLEAWLGYLRTSRHLQELPSWDDLGRASLPYARDGTLRNPYRIRADWLLFGAAWRVLDARFCNLIGGFACGHGWRRVGIVARLGFLGSVRSTDFSELPNSVQMARGDHVRLDAGFGVNTGLRYALSEGFSIRLLFHVLMPNLFDVIGEEGPSVLGQSHRQREADYDNRPLWALSVGFGFSSFPGVNP
jgi:hypothetical protein